MAGSTTLDGWWARLGRLGRLGKAWLVQDGRMDGDSSAEGREGGRMPALVWGSGEGVQGPDIVTPSTNG